MCQSNGSDDRATSGVGRRGLLLGGAAGSLGIGAAALAPGAFAQGRPAKHSKPFGAAELVILGTAAGPPPEPDRAGISSALHIDGKNYLIDCGRSSVTNYYNVGLRYADLDAVFITHLHADHVADYYNIFLLAGWGVTDDNDALTQRVDVYGPGPAGALRPPLRGGDVPTVSPGDPTPGLADMTEHLIAAYAYSSNLFIRDSGSPDPRDLIAVHELALPASVHADALTDTAPLMDPFPVMEDDRVRVSATLVPHGPVFPSFAYRFDTDHGSVVFSGDTSLTPNLVRLAKDADILVHEAIDLEALGDLPPAALDHLKQSHTSVADVGKVAEAAGVETLVLSHLVPSAHSIVSDARWRKRAQRGFSGRVVVGEDLMRIALPR
ncbi:MAG TPA: MBL fold metallo-hydrolase [Nocardioides sp.]|nr:MBL fold metallo-hydrolase [Nocardioides sp.]